MRSAIRKSGFYRAVLHPEADSFSEWSRATPAGFASACLFSLDQSGFETILYALQYT